MTELGDIEQVILKSERLLLNGENPFYVADYLYNRLRRAVRLTPAHDLRAEIINILDTTERIVIQASGNERRMRS